jgi:hypothetical protein
MSEPSSSDTPLTATFNVKLDGGTISMATVGQAYRFITTPSSIEWMEFRSLHHDAVSSLRSAAENAMLAAPATNALRTLLARAGLLS